MKKFFKAASLMLICATFTGIVSCSDDKKEEPKTPEAAKEVAGTYTGDIDCYVMGTLYTTYTNNTFVITAEDEDDVTIKIPAYGEGNMMFPEITVTDVDVEGADGKYTLEETNFAGSFESGTAYTGSIGGKFENNTLTLNFSYAIGAMPPMTCVFTAPKN